VALALALTLLPRDPSANLLLGDLGPAEIFPALWPSSGEGVFLEASSLHVVTGCFTLSSCLGSF
jgi:hypothetical protein